MPLLMAAEETPTFVINTVKIAREYILKSHLIPAIPVLRIIVGEALNKF
jgi:hypothetical protein